MMMQLRWISCMRLLLDVDSVAWQRDDLKMLPTVRCFVM